MCGQIFSIHLISPHVCVLIGQNPVQYEHFGPKSSIICVFHAFVTSLAPFLDPPCNIHVQFHYPHSFCAHFSHPRDIFHASYTSSHAQSIFYRPITSSFTFSSHPISFRPLNIHDPFHVSSLIFVKNPHNLGLTA